MKHKIFNIYEFLPVLKSDAEEIVDIHFKNISIMFDKNSCQIVFIFPEKWMFEQSKDLFFARIKNGKPISSHSSRVFPYGPSKFMFQLIDEVFFEINSISLFETNRNGEKAIVIALDPPQPIGMTYSFKYLLKKYERFEEPLPCENCGEPSFFRLCPKCQKNYQTRMRHEAKATEAFLKARQKRYYRDIKTYNKEGGFCNFCGKRLISENFEKKDDSGWFVRRVDTINIKWDKIIKKKVLLCNNCDETENTVQKIIAGDLFSKVTVEVFGAWRLPIGSFSFDSSKRKVWEDFNCPQSECQPFFIISGGEVSVNVNLDFGRNIGMTTPCNRCGSVAFWRCFFDLSTVRDFP